MKRRVERILAVVEALEAEARRMLRTLQSLLKPPRRRRYWSRKDLAQLRKLYPDMSTAKVARRMRRSVCSLYAQAMAMGIKKSAAYLASGEACRWNGREPRSVVNRFKKGQVPWNKGKKGYRAPGSEKGWFKKGRPKEANNTWRPIGTVTVDADGYSWTKVRETGVRSTAWKMTHVLLWEKHRGPVPKGMIVIFRNKNRADIRYRNLKLISRPDHMRRNTIHRYPVELKKTIRALGKLRRTIRRKDEEQN